jgi:ABC-type branched-subunit amino acid transport system ATPase component
MGNEHRRKGELMDRSRKMPSGLFNKIEEIKEKGPTTLIVEQNANRSLRMSNYAYVVEMGKNRTEGPAEQIRNDAEIKRLYLGGSDSRK